MARIAVPVPLPNLLPHQSGLFLTTHRHIQIRFVTDAHLGVVIRCTFQLIHHSHIHIHLTNVLVGQLARFSTTNNLEKNILGFTLPNSALGTIMAVP
jgi:hypothetical protein